MAKQDGVVKLTLDRDVALVVFDFLARAADEEGGEPLQDALLHKAELPALLDLLAVLEERLEEPFASDYARKVEAARDSIIDRLGTVEI
jgi:hypothetical protein